MTNSMRDVLGVIREVQLELGRMRMEARSDLHELARRRIHAPHEILDWAKRDRRWSFTLAEVLRDPTERPRDLAARLVLAIADELEQERETLQEREAILTDAAEPRAAQADVTTLSQTETAVALAE